MNEGRARLLLIITLTTAVLALCGCSKKETPAGPKKTATATDTAAKEKPVKATEAAGQEQSAPAFNAGSLMASVDKNGDGKVTQAEYYAIWKDKSVAERNFKMIDKNGDGVLTAEEFAPKLGTK
jgi:Ca2+-binding EF-hand superfamily protein